MHFLTTVTPHLASGSLLATTDFEFFADVNPDELISSQNPALGSPEQLPMMDLDRIVRSAVDEAAVELLRTRGILTDSKVKGDTDLIYKRTGIPLRDPDITKPGVKLWYLGPKSSGG